MCEFNIILFDATILCHKNVKNKKYQQFCMKQKSFRIDHRG